MRVLVVEDDRLIAQSVRLALEEDGYVVDSSADGVTADVFVRQEHYDAVILDIGLPDRSGLDLVRDWRKRSLPVPVLVLTVRHHWEDRVQGLDAGADDYLIKPFYPAELTARVRAIIRRSYGFHENVIRVNGYQLDEARRVAVTPAGEEIGLTSTEFRMLRLLMHNRDRVLSKEQLIERLYTLDDTPEINLIEAYITRLRRKLGRRAIRTLHGHGYVFPSKG